MAGWEPIDWVHPTQPAARVDEDRGGPGGALGLLQNAGRGLWNLGTGLTQLAGSGVHDLAKGVAEVATLGQADVLGGYQLDDLGRSAVGWGDQPSSLLQHYKDYYGPLSRGDFSAFGENVYEDPLGLALDAATVLTAGGAGAAKGAQFASRLPSVARGTRALTLAESAGAAGDVARAAELAAEAGSAARAVKAILPGAGTGGYLGGTRTVLRGMEAVEVPLPLNPVRRALTEPLFHKAVTRPIGRVEAELGDLAADTAEAGRLGAVLEAAKEAGVQRLYRPGWERHVVVRKIADGIFGGGQSRFYQDRAAARTELEEILRAAPDPEEVTRVAQGVAPDFSPGPVVHDASFPAATPFDLADDVAIPAATAGGEMGIFDALAPAFGSRGVHALPDTPDASGPRVGAVVEISDWREAGNAVERAAAALGGRVAGVRNYLLRPHLSGYRGMTVAVELPDGRVAEISVHTPTSRAAAEAVAPDLERLRGLSDPAEAAAATRYIQSIFEGTTREAAEQFGGIPYDDALRSVDRLRVWVHRQLTEPEIATGYLTYREAFERALGPVRIEAVHGALSEAQERLRAHLATSDLPMKGGKGAARALRKQLADEGRFDASLATTEQLSLQVHGLLGNLLSDGRLLQRAANRRGYAATLMAELREVLGSDEAVRAIVGDEQTVRGIVGRVRKFLTRKEFTAFDFDAGDFWRLPGTDPVELGEALRGAGLPTPVYFPHISASRARFSDFMLRGKRLENLSTRKPDFVTKRWMGYLYEKGQYITDPRDAYLRRASQVIRHQEVLRMVEETARRLGRPVSSLDQVAEGERVWNPHALRRNFRVGQAMEEETAARLADRMDLETSTSQALREVVPQGVEEMVRTFRATKGQTLYAVPAYVAKRLEEQAKIYLGWKARLFFDGPTNVWRNAVLSLSPRWIWNNVLGNIVFLKLHGGSLTEAIRQLMPRYQQRLRFAFGGKLPEGTDLGFFSVGAGHPTEFGSAAVDNRLVQAVSAAKGLPPARMLSSASSWMRNFNTYIENAFRRSSFVKAAERELAMRDLRGVAGSFYTSQRTLETIARDGLTEAAGLRAVEQVNRFLGDYSKLGPYERQLIRRFVMPFYSFYKHVARLVVSLPIATPVKANVLGLLHEMTESYFAELGPVPEWLASAVPAGEIDGTPLFLQGRAANPFESLFSSPTGVLSSLGPIPKVAVEQQLGRSLFNDREFTSEDVVQPFGSDQNFEVVRDGDGNVVDVVPVNKVTPSLLEHALSQFPQYQLAQDIAAGGAQYSASGQVITDETGEPRYPTPAWIPLARYLGLNFTPFDLEGYQQGAAEDHEAALRQALRQQPTTGTASPAGSWQPISWG